MSALKNKILEAVFWRLRAIGLNILPPSPFSDRWVSFCHFVNVHHRFPRNPGGFNDRLYRLKTSDEIDDPLRRRVTDKELVKDYVREKLDDSYNIDTLGVIRSKDELASYDFPENCVIKGTHGSGMVEFRRDGGPVDRAELATWFDKDFYTRTRERNYKGMAPKIILEPFLFDSVPEDYKFFCANGVVTVLQIDIDRFGDHRKVMLDRDLNRLDFSLTVPQADGQVSPPENIHQMIAAAEALAADFSFMRVDLYSNGREIKLGELTNCHENATGRFIPASSEGWASDVILGRKTATPEHYVKR